MHITVRKRYVNLTEIGGKTDLYGNDEQIKEEKKHICAEIPHISAES